MSEVTVRSREEDDELQRSTKKVKENHQNKISYEPQLPCTDEGGRSIEISSWESFQELEKGLDFENIMETEVMSNDEDEEDLPREGTVWLSGDRKGKIRAV